MKTALSFATSLTALLLAQATARTAERLRGARQGPASLKYLWAKAYYIPPETTTEESGYFSLCEGKNGRIYVGSAAYGRNSYLVEFDPATEKMRVVLDTHKLVGLPLTPTGYAAQSKIHTRNSRALRQDLRRLQAGVSHRHGEKDWQDRHLPRRLRHGLRPGDRQGRQPRYAHAPE